MHRIRRRLKSFAWVALLAFVGLAVAPTVSRAIHLGGRAAELASADGAAAMAAMAHHQPGHHHGPVSSDPAPKPVEHEHSLDHCAMCGVAAAAFALAATPASLAPERAIGPDADAPAPAAPGRRDDWSPASPRGPPALV